MAVTNWAGLANTAYQKLVQANSQAVQDTSNVNDTSLRARKAYADSNKTNVGNTWINAADRGMQYSGPAITNQNNIAKTYKNQLDLTNRNKLGSLATIAKNKLAAKTTYDQTIAQIHASQAAAAMSRIAQLPAGINFAALRAADPAYKK